MDGIRIVSLAYIHTTSDDQRSFFHLPASTRTPHRVRLLHPLCFHSPCCIATGGSQMALSLHSCPFSIVRCTRRLAGRRRALYPHPEQGSCTHYVLNLRHLHRVLPILSHIEPTFDVRLIASFCLRLWFRSCVILWLRMPLCCCCACVSYRLCSPLCSVSLPARVMMLTDPCFFLSYYPAYRNVSSLPCLPFLEFLPSCFLSFFLLFCPLFDFGLLEAPSRTAVGKLVLASCWFSAFSSHRDGYALLHLCAPLRG
jgi:hypothetical protein